MAEDRKQNRGESGEQRGLHSSHEFQRSGRGGEGDCAASAPGLAGWSSGSSSTQGEVGGGDHQIPPEPESEGDGGGNLRAVWQGEIGGQIGTSTQTGTTAGEIGGASSTADWWDQRADPFAGDSGALFDSSTAEQRIRRRVAEIREREFAAK
jgi:hypothetical protein